MLAINSLIICLGAMLFLILANMISNIRLEARIEKLENELLGLNEKFKNGTGQERRRD